MKNNKGYYSWIHSLNRAGLESQKRGFKILNEAKRGRPSQFPEDLSDLKYDAAEHAKIAAEKRSAGEELSNDRRRAAIGKASPINLDPNLFDGPDSGYEGNAPEVARGQREAELDFEDDDWKKEMEDAAAIRAHAMKNRANWYAKQDAAAEEDAAEFEDEMRGAGHGSISLGSGKHPYKPENEHLPESVSQKINRMLNG
jgi:hypothetical protein